MMEWSTVSNATVEKNNKGDHSIVRSHQGVVANLEQCSLSGVVTPVGGLQRWNKTVGLQVSSELSGNDTLQ